MNPSSSLLHSYPVHFCSCLPQLINFHSSSFSILRTAFFSSLTISFFILLSPVFSPVPVFHYSSSPVFNTQYFSIVFIALFFLPLYLVIAFCTASICLNSNIQLTSFLPPAPVYPKLLPNSLTYIP